MRSTVIIVLLASLPALAQRPGARATGWHTDYAAAKAEAKRTGKPMFVVFRCEP